MNEIVSKKLNDFFTSGRKMLYKKDEIILRAGEPIFGIFYLKKGFVRQYLITEEGEEITIHIFRPGAFFPLMLVVTDTPNRYYFEAETAVETYRVAPVKVLDFIKTEPDLLLDVTIRFGQAIVGLSRRIETLAIGNVQTKVVALIFYLAKQFGETKNNETVINLPLTHNEIAAWVGAKRETVSRQMEKLAKDGIIKQEKHLLIIKDKQKLSQALHQPDLESF